MSTRAVRALQSGSALVAVATLIGACGGSSTTKPTAYPAAAGQTMDALHRQFPEGAVLAPSGAFFAAGTHRFGFALMDTTHRLIHASSVALYSADASGNHLQGPFVAHDESLAVAPRFQSKTVAEDPSAAHDIWVTDLNLAANGPQRITGVADVNGRRVALTEDQIQVGASGPQPPEAGQRAIPIHTPTVASVGGNAASIDTRQPPAGDLQAVDFASVLGRKPVVLVFATPQLCSSRVCGPVVDVAEQVRAQLGSRAAFIHMEIYKANDPTKGLRPQVDAWHLPTEPWTFVIDRNGIIRTVLQGAFSAQELSRAVVGASA